MLAEVRRPAAAFVLVLVAVTVLCLGRGRVMAQTPESGLLCESDQHIAVQSFMDSEPERIRVSETWLFVEQSMPRPPYPAEYGVAIYDLSDPLNPQRRSKWLFPDNREELIALHVSGEVAYLLMEPAFGNSTILVVLDLSPPDRARLVSRTELPTPHSHLTHSSIAGLVNGHLIVQNSRIEVGIVDVRDPSQPVQRESWDGRIYLSALVGDVAYAVDFRTITALDVSDPLNPVEIGSIEAPRQLAYGQAAVSPDGTVGYFPGLEWAVGNGHMLVLDIADPSLMRVVDRINTGRTPIFMRTQDRLVLYAPRGPDEPRVYRWVAYDTSDPLRPEKIGVKFVGFRSDKGFNTHPIEGTPYLLHYSSSGMSILDTSVWPGDPIAQELTDIPLAGPVRGMAKQTARLFVSAEPDQLLAIDAREVARPVVTASLSARAGGLVAEPGRLVLASEDGVTVFDTSHPGFPVRRGTIPLPPGATAVESFDLEGTLVVAALREAGLWTIDISDPDRPVTRSRILTDSDGLGPIAVALIEDQAYVSTRTFDGRHYTLGGWLVNLSEPDSPVVNSVPGVGGTYHFHRVGTRWLWNGGVYLDVSDPRNPQIIGVATHRLGDHRAVPDYAYLHVLGFNQIVTFDTRSPSYVQRKETFWQEELEIGEDAVGVRVGRHLYAAGDGGRLYRINLSDCPSCPADMDADGVLTVFDWLAFQTAFERGLPAADFDGNGRHTLTDYLAFLDAFNAGCP